VKQLLFCLTRNIPLPKLWPAEYFQVELDWSLPWKRQVILERQHPVKAAYYQDGA
jgi:hypothetical protein